MCIRNTDGRGAGPHLKPFTWHMKPTKVYQSLYQVYRTLALPYEQRKALGKHINHDSIGLWPKSKRKYPYGMTVQFFFLQTANTTHI